MQQQKKPRYNDEVLVRNANNLLGEAFLSLRQRDIYGCFRQLDEVLCIALIIKDKQHASRVKGLILGARGTVFFLLEMEIRAYHYIYQAQVIFLQLIGADYSKDMLGKDVEIRESNSNKLQELMEIILKGTEKKERLLQRKLSMKPVDSNALCCSQAQIILQYGNALLKNGNMQDAMEKFKQLLSIAKMTTNESQSLSIECKALERLGFVKNKLRAFSEAIEYYHQWLTKSKERKNKQEERTALSRIGNAHCCLHQYLKAIEYYKRALEISQERKNFMEQAQDLSVLGNLYDNRGQYGTAELYYKQLLQLNSYNNDIQGIGVAYGNLGNIYTKLGNNNKSFTFYMKALRIFQCLENKQHVSTALGNIVALCNESGYKTEADKIHQIRINYYTKTHENREHFLSQMGQHCDENHNYDSAILYYIELLDIYRKKEDQRGESHACSNLGLAYDSKGDHKKAIEYHTRALVISQGICDKQLEAEYLFNLGVTYLDYKNEPEEAKPFLKKSVQAHRDVWDNLNTDQQRVTYGNTSNLVNATRALTRTYVRLGKPEKALVNVESSYSRAFKHLLQKQLEKDVSCVATSEKEQYTELMLDDLERAAVNAETCIIVYCLVSKSSVSDFMLLAWVIGSNGELKYSPQEASVKPQGKKRSIINDFDAVKGFDSLTLLVELTRRTLGAGARYMYGKSAENAMAEAQLKVAKEIKKDDSLSAKEFKKCFNSDPSFQRSLINRFLEIIYELLIAPLVEALEGETKLLIIPDKDLFAVPFAALRDSVEEKSLVEKYALFLAPSVGVVMHLAQRAKNQSKGTASDSARALVVGNPNFSDWKRRESSKPLQQLPGTESEIKAIENELPIGMITHVCKGDEATKPAVVKLARKASLIHLATHGKPDGKGIYLAGNSEDNATLTEADVQAHSLPELRLVVLSTCDSFKGKLCEDGVVGIARAFLVAGAQTVVCTQWKLDDTSTSVFMTKFYKELCAGEKGIDVAVALQSAMKWMIEKDFIVSQWASFVIYGLSRVCDQRMSDMFTKKIHPETKSMLIDD